MGSTVALFLKGLGLRLKLGFLFGLGRECSEWPPFISNCYTRIQPIWLLWNLVLVHSASWAPPWVELPIKFLFIYQAFYILWHGPITGHSTRIVELLHLHLGDRPEYSRRTSHYSDRMSRGAPICFPTWIYFFLDIKIWLLLSIKAI